MKDSKRYIAFALCLALAVLVKFHMSYLDTGSVSDFRGGSLDKQVWYPLVADAVNSQVIKVVIDNKEYTSQDYQFYMDDQRNIMVPVSILRDALNCSAHVYNDQSLLVEKHSTEAFFTLNSLTASKNGDEVKVVSSLAKIGDQYYVSLNDLSDLLDYKCSFNVEENTLTASDTSESATVLPSSYDLRERNRTSMVYNQGTSGTCWAFAATSALESSILPEEKALFSVDHMTLCNSFDLNLKDGGEYTMGMAYLAAWQGPVYAKDDPNGDGETDASLEAVRHVQEMQIIEGKDYEAIKLAVFKYGGVESSLYSNLKSSVPDSEYYNAQTNSYCYIGTEKPNHDIVIVGWDDSYSKDNFKGELEGDGAFICQNSWGSSFGDNGYFYVSYYDTNIGTHNVCYTRVDAVDNYDKIYQSDLCGWVGSIGYEKEDLYAANVFTAESAESLKAVGFYATGSDTSYRVYVVADYSGTGSLASRQKVAEGTLDNAGYYTVDLDQAIALTKGHKFAVVVYLDTPGSTHPLAIEYQSEETYLDQVDLSDGEGYISYNGLNFTNVKKQQDCNLCIKAYTDEQ